MKKFFENIKPFARLLRLGEKGGKKIERRRCLPAYPCVCKGSAVRPPTSAWLLGRILKALFQEWDGLKDTYSKNTTFYGSCRNESEGIHHE